jgi:hypothetical protein
MSTSKSSSGIGFFGLLTIAFIILKLCKVIEWSWWWVLCPLWGPVALGLLVLPFYLYAKYKEAKDELNRAESGYNKAAWNNGGKSKWQQRIEQMQEAQKVAQLCKELPGKRAIHSISGNAGIITSVKPDGEGNDVWVVIDNGKIGGHRHYFYIEGERGTGGELFEKNKHIHFK